MRFCHKHPWEPLRAGEEGFGCAECRRERERPSPEALPEKVVELERPPIESLEATLRIVNQCFIELGREPVVERDPEIRAMLGKLLGPLSLAELQQLTTALAPRHYRKRLATVWFAKATELAEHGLVEKAREAARQAVELGNGQPEHRLLLAELHLRCGSPETAKAELEHLDWNALGEAEARALRLRIDLGIEPIDSMLRLGRVNSCRGEIGLALCEYHAVRRQLAGSGDPRYFMATERILDLDPGNVELAIELAEHRLEGRDHWRAAPLLEHALKFRPPTPRALLVLARALAIAGKKDEAIGALERAVRLGDLDAPDVAAVASRELQQLMRGESRS